MNIPPKLLCGKRLAGPISALTAGPHRHLFAEPRIQAAEIVIAPGVFRSILSAAGAEGVEHIDVERFAEGLVSSWLLVTLKRVSRMVCAERFENWTNSTFQVVAVGSRGAFRQGKFAYTLILAGACCISQVQRKRMRLEI